MTSTDPAAQPKIRQRVRKLVDHPTFQKTIMTLIVINAVTLGFETSPTIMGYIGPALQVFDKIVIAIFCVEIVLRIYAHGPAFFRDLWGIFFRLYRRCNYSDPVKRFPVSTSFITCVTRVETRSAVPRLRRPSAPPCSQFPELEQSSRYSFWYSTYLQSLRPNYWSYFSRLVRYHRRFHVHTISGYDVGELVNGNCPSCDGGLLMGMDCVCGIYRAFQFHST